MRPISLYGRLISVIGKVPELRADYECQQVISWFRNKSGLFQSLKSEIVSDVIRYCEFERKQRDDVLIKQGDSGDKLYIILKGAASIYVIQDKESPHDILQQVEQVCAKQDLEREHLGQYVWTSGEGKSFGEIALLKDDCIRTATVVADCDTDLVIIDRNLYNRSVRDVLEREFIQKTTFVEENTLFQQWPTKQKKLVVVALKKETVKYGGPLSKQGNPAENMFFVLNGEVEVTCDQSTYHSQYVELWHEMETLLPGLLPRTPGLTETPHESLRRKRTQHKLLQMCLLGSNEIVGVLEILLGLPTSLTNSIVTREAEVLLLSKENFERLFMKKYAVRAMQTLRERLTMRLYLYIHRTEVFDSTQKSPFLKFLSFLSQDEKSLQDLKKLKRKEREEKKGIVSSLTNGTGDGDKMNTKDAERVSNMLKVLDIKPRSPHGRLPVTESGQKVINDIEAGLENWKQRSKGTNSPVTVRNKVARHKTFSGNELLNPMAHYHQTRSLTRSKTPTLNE